MGWSIGWDSRYNRDIGYGVIAYCDHPKCNMVIDRGLSYVCCDEEPYGGEHGCGLYFCSKHQDYRGRCPKCARHDHKPNKPKPDHPDWIKHKQTDSSWTAWRREQQNDVERV